MVLLTPSTPRLYVGARSMRGQGGANPHQARFRESLNSMAQMNSKLVYPSNGFSRSPRVTWTTSPIRSDLSLPFSTKTGSRAVRFRQPPVFGVVEPFDMNPEARFAMMTMVHQQQMASVRSMYRMQWLSARRADLDDALVASNYQHAAFLWRSAHHRTRRLVFEREQEWREEVAPAVHVARRMTGYVAWYRRLDWLTRAHVGWLRRLSAESVHWVTLDNLSEKVGDIFSTEPGSQPPRSTLPRGAVVQGETVWTAEDEAIQTEQRLRRENASWAADHPPLAQEVRMPPPPPAWGESSDGTNMFGVVPLPEGSDGSVAVAMPPVRPAATRYRPAGETAYNPFQTKHVQSFTDNMAKRVKERLQFLSATARSGSGKTNPWELLQEAKFKTRGYIE
eukprot:TRINITY_DN23936_c0_g1_i1.p1 TRINITY_DN23936_c0_g1~~TRINITY_DN23936_c0_g1_i1.p1  ORF type:complete len:393 (+),score=60.12 TRINITY_DN23936_c0_g1_i1:225-1403(+)